MNIDYQVFHPMPFGHLSFRPDFAAPHFRRTLGENSFRRWKVEKKMKNCRRFQKRRLRAKQEILKCPSRCETLRVLLTDVPPGYFEL